jgi:hypothetical protein
MTTQLLESRHAQLEREHMQLRVAAAELVGAAERVAAELSAGIRARNLGSTWTNLQVTLAAKAENVRDITDRT